MSEAVPLDIVIDCLRAELAGQTPQIASPADDLSRDEAIALARQNKVLSLVRKRLVPASQAGVSLSDAARTLATNGGLLKELGALAPLFRAAKIDFLAIKGPLQQQVLYGHAFQRPAADLDLLVRPQQFSRAAKALEAAGYVVGTPSVWWRDTLGEQHFRKAGPPAIAVDLHHSVDQPGTPRSNLGEILFAHATEVDAGGEKVPTLDASGGLLLCTVSIAKALYNREPAAAYLCDLFVGLKAASPDAINSLFTTARSAGLGGTAAAALALMAALFDVDVDLREGQQHLFRRMPVHELMTMVFMPRHPTTRWPKRREMLWHLCERQPVRYGRELGRVLASEVMRRLFERPKAA